MGAKTWMLVYATGTVSDTLRSQPQLDRAATQQLAGRLFPKDKLEPVGDGDLSYTCPPDDELYIASFPGVSIVAAKEFGLTTPPNCRLFYQRRSRWNNLSSCHAQRR